MPIDAAAERLADIGVKSAGIVDPNCWGHVRWMKALAKRDIKPMFGLSFQVELEDKRKPMAWILAEDTKSFYRYASADDFTEASLAETSGIIRFAGDALIDPASFDYIDVGLNSIWSINRALALHKKTKKPLVAVVDNWYSAEADRMKFRSITDNQMTTPQWILSEKELKQYAPWIPKKAYAGSREVAERLEGTELQKAPMIEFKGNLLKLVEKGKRRRCIEGLKWTPEYRARLARELAMIEKKKYESYFIVVSDLVDWAKQHMLVGPARGSSAGSLVCYLLRITEVDPLVHGLLFERFIDINRDDLPDIDIDFSDTKRYMVFDYLADKYGRENVARLGNVSALQSKSLMAECGKRLAIPANDTFAVKNVLIEYSSGDSRYGKGLEDTLTNTGAGKAFMEAHPNASYMTGAEGHAWHTSIHAAGVIVSNEPITDYCCVKDGVTQLDKKDSEELNLLKIDVLGLRTLGIIEDAGVMTPDELYALPMDDQKVLDVVNDRRFAGIFQFEGSTQRLVSMSIPITSFRVLDHITALARPGPLGGGAANTYTDISNGKAKPSFAHESMKAYLEETNGVVLYQEQVMKIVRELGEFSWAETSAIRKAMSARKGVEYFDQRKVQFVKGCSKKGIEEKIAEDIWRDICSFGAWGMNASHTCSYAMISYWCAYLKCYHHVEFAAALLRSAKDNEQTIETLRELQKEGVEYSPFDLDLSRENWAVIGGKVVGGFMNLHGIGPAKAAILVKARDEDTLTEKQFITISNAEVSFENLEEARTRYPDLYAHPSHYNISGPIKEFADLEDYEAAVVICKLVKKERRDENETVRMNWRGGKKYDGPSLFLDLLVVDDSISKPAIARFRPELWQTHGELMADRAIDGQDWFIFRGQWLKQFSMLIIKKAKCLTNEELFNAKA